MHLSSLHGLRYFLLAARLHPAQLVEIDFRGRVSLPGVVRRPPYGATRAAFIFAAALAVSCGSQGAASRDGAAGAGGAAGATGLTGHGDASAGDGAGPDATDGADKTGPLADAAAPITGTAVETFDTESDFGFNPYHDTLQMNLGNPDTVDGGAAPTLAFDSTVGSPRPGSLKVTIPFSGPNQYVDAQSYVFAVPQDWSGHTLHVRLKVDEGSIFRGFAQLYVDTGVSYVPADSNVTVAPGSEWQDIAMDLSHPMTSDPSGRFNPKQVVLYGLQLNSGSAGAGATPASFHIDSFSLE